MEKIVKRINEKIIKNKCQTEKYTQRVKGLSFLNLLVSKMIPFSYVEDDYNMTSCSILDSPS